MLDNFFSLSKNQILPKTKHKLPTSYTLQNRVGKGANGKVYRATNNEPDSIFPAIFACKVQDINSPRRRTKIRHEISLMRKLSHPNIAKYFFSIETSSDSRIFLQYCEKGELFTYLKQTGPMSESICRDIMRQLLSVLCYLNELDIVHRDLKLENILLTSENTIQVIDFGLAKQLRPAERCYTVCGSTYYVAPELLACKTTTNNGYSKEIDMWGCGVILFMILSNMPPFYETEFCSIRLAISRAKFSFDFDVFDDVSQEAKDLIKGMLTLRPLRRLKPEQARAHVWLR